MSLWDSVRDPFQDDGGSRAPKLGGDPGLAVVFPTPSLALVFSDPTERDARPRQMKTLTIVQGSTEPIALTYQDSMGATRTVADVDRASLAVRDFLADTASRLLLDTVGVGGLVLDGLGLGLTATLSQVQADAMPVGVFVGQLGLHLATGDDWRFSEPFNVRVIRASAPKVV